MCVRSGISLHVDSCSKLVIELVLPCHMLCLLAGVSQLYDRLGDMETAMRELAHAQATSSSVLSELGGRLGPAAATTSAWPPHASTASPGEHSCRNHSATYCL